ncbi:MAG: hypothetical protein PHO14_05670 [Kiritimatiellae bacterium]|jgi:hypothetical protein|nr:hypothetical protein [Kiritimatiellia bacterium]MDD4341706.1 hypothetical protein [Kiritimatiellia bacterium]MDY0149645.1 hypothetical protein [Kiritimatiellia bacterium]
MIHLPLADWVVVVLAIHLAVILGAGVYYALRRVRWVPRHRAAPFIFRCSVCGHVYLDRRNVPMAECGKCGNMNECIKNV